MRWLLLVLATACSSPGGGGRADAGSRGDAHTAPDSDAAPPDSGTGEDAAPDGGMDGPCPRRTAPPGEPEEPVPPSQVIDGSVDVSDPSELDGIRVVTGDLYVESDAATVVLPDVEVVGGALVINRPETQEVSLPALETVGYRIVVYGENTASVSMPRLETVGLGIQLAQNPTLASMDLSCLRSTVALAVFETSLTSLDLPRLRRIETIQLVNNPLLAAVDLSRLTSCGKFTVEDGAALTSLHLPALAENPFGFELNRNPVLEELVVGPVTTMSVVELRSLPALTTLSAPAIQEIGLLQLDNVDALTSLDGLSTLTTVGWLELYESDALTDVSGLDAVTTASSVVVRRVASLPALPMAGLTTVANKLWIEGNPELQSIGFGALADIGGSTQEVWGNPKLPACQVEALRDRLIAAGETADWITGGNDEDATCP